jgi:asparagine synthase (glutamine-hydrolysing)
MRHQPRIVGVVASDASTLIEKLLASGQPGGIGPPDAGSRAVLAATGQGATKSMAKLDGIEVVLDGGIYNRGELGAGDTDARLLAELYRRHGFEGALSRINGEFAIALYDHSTGTLWLARDRLGIKPLYYASTPELFAFASRPRTLTGLPGVGSAINRRFAAVFGASHYRYIDNRPEESPYERVHQLPGAHWLSVKGGQVSTGRYWHLEDLPDWTEDEDTLAERYRDLLLDAVKIRLQTSERPAFTLSGGMDSSSVLACAARLSGAKQEAFSTVYSDKTYDESDEIRSMLDHAVSRWNPVAVDNPDVFAIIARMVEVNDEPVATATWLSHFLLCEEVASRGFGALFGGLGGDELNAGEYEYFFFHFADLRAAGRTDDLAHEIDRWAAHHDHPIYRKNAEVAAAQIRRCTDPAAPGRCLPDPERMRRYFSTLDPEFFDVETFVPVMEAPFESYLKTRSYQDLTRETAPCCLRAEDRQTAAFGLENHVPFFDHRLIEFMFRIPGDMKIRAGVTKVLLRRAMQDLLPEETRTRIKKTGWNAPAHLWFTGRGREPLHDMIHSRAFRERGVYRVNEVERLVKEHEDIVASGAVRENHMMFIWQMVNLETWLASVST